MLDRCLQEAHEAPDIASIDEMGIYFEVLIFGSFEGLHYVSSSMLASIVLIKDLTVKNVHLGLNLVLISVCGGLFDGNCVYCPYFVYVLEFSVTFILKLLEI